MSSSDNSGCVLILSIIAYAVCWIGTGVLMWNWIDPKSFGGGVLFFILWSLFGYVAQTVAAFFVVAIASYFEES